MATSQQVQALYVGYFGRPADPSGLSFWSDGDESSTEQMEALADTIATSTEYKASIAGNSLEAIINQFYQNLFNRNADVAGLNFWVEQIGNGNTNTQDVGLEIGRAALASIPAEGETNSDNAAILAKTAAADLWTAEISKSTENILAYQGAAAVEAGQNYLQPIVAEPLPTEAEVTADVVALVDANSVAGSDKLELSIFQDVATSEEDYLAVSTITNEIQQKSSFRFTSANQIVDGEVGTTYQAADRLLDAVTTDSDILNLSSTGALAQQDTTVQNLESVVLAATNASGTYRNDSMTGSKSLTVTGTVANAGNVTFDISNTNTGITTIDTSGLTGTASGANATSLAITGRTGNVDYTITNGDVAASQGTGITTGSGDDTITSGAGSDTINAGAGVNTINAGAGTNTINGLGQSGSADTVINDVVSTTAAGVAGTGVVTATATATGLTVTGDGSANTVNASTSTAVVTLVGGAGSDTLTGGTAGDTITGGTGADNMTGGAGGDTFISAAGDSPAVTAFTGTAANMDVQATDTFTVIADIITDFNISTDGDGFQTGVVGAVTTVSATQDMVVTTNNVVRGDYDTTTNVFTVDFAAGADVVLFVTDNTGALNNAASYGTQTTILAGFGGNIADIVAGTFT